MDRLPEDLEGGVQQHALSQSEPQTISGATHRPSVDNTLLEDDEHIAIDSLRVPSAYSSVEQVLIWPIFSDEAAAQRIANNIFATQSSDLKDADAEEYQARHLAFNTNFHHMSTSQNMTQLVERFMSSVHSKIPFLDPSLLRRSAKRAEELGTAWDCSSCLVVS